MGIGGKGRDSAPMRAGTHDEGRKSQLPLLGAWCCLTDTLHEMPCFSRALQVKIDLESEHGVFLGAV